MGLIVIAMAVVAGSLAFGRRSPGARAGLVVAALAVPLLLVVLLGRGVDSGGDGGSISQEQPVAFFLAPLEATTVSNPVQLTMGAEHLGNGHFHVTVDASCVEPGEPIPSDAAHRHFAPFQSEAALDLAPGMHTLCLQVGDPAHHARGRSDRIVVEVRPAA